MKIKDEIDELISHFPGLSVIEQIGSKHILEGEIDVFDANDSYCDSFKIRLIKFVNKPNSFPFLFEIGDRIEKIDDRHIGKDGLCCVCIMHEQEIREYMPITLLQYMNEYCIPFFANQIYYEKKEKWAGSDYEHGRKGILQFYQEHLRIREPYKITNELKNYLAIKQKHYQLCFCNSGKKFKKCHKRQHDFLGKFSDKRIQEDIKYLQNIKN